MTAYSISLTIGDGNIGHNSNSKRRERLANVDAERTKENVTIVHNPIRKAYHELFDEAVDQYNKSQKRAERRISDYYSKIYNSKKEKPFYEFVIQIGNMDNHPNMNVTNEIYTEFVKQIQLKYPQIYVFGAYIHNDEASPHLHLDYIPFAYYEKGLNKRVSLSKSMSQMGYSFNEGSGRSKGLYKAFRANLLNDLEQICMQHDIQRENMHNTEKHEANVQLFKQRASLKREVNELTTEKQTISRSVADSQSELADINRDIENKMQQLDSLENSIVNNPIIQLTNDKEILEILDQAKRDIDNNNNFYSRIDSREINKAIPKFDDSWLSKNVEYIPPKTDIFGHVKVDGYYKIDPKEWEQKQIHFNRNKDAFNQLKNMYSYIRAKFKELLANLKHINSANYQRLGSIDSALKEIKKLPVFKKWKSISESTNKIDQLNLEVTSLTKSLEGFKWFKQFYNRALPVLHRSTTQKGTSSLDEIIQNYSPKTQEIIRFDLNSLLSKEFKEIVYYKGDHGYGWYSSKSEGGVYLGSKNDTASLKKTYAKARFKDPYGLVSHRGYAR